MPATASSGTATSPIWTRGTAPVNDTDVTTPVRVAPVSSMYCASRPTRAAAVWRMPSAKLSVEVLASAVSCSIDASCVVWASISFVFIGELGSWLDSWATSSFRNTSESSVVLRSAAGTVLPVCRPVAVMGGMAVMCPPVQA